MLNQTFVLDELQNKLTDVMEAPTRLRNISENLAIAAALIDNTTTIAIPAHTVEVIRLGLVEQVADQVMTAVDIQEKGIRTKYSQFTEDARKERLEIKADIEQFKSKYQNDQFKNLGYIEIGDAGSYMVSSSSETWYVKLFSLGQVSSCLGPK